MQYAVMQDFPNTHPNVFYQFMDGNLCSRRKPGNFNMIASGQCIEQTTNREQKCPGGITGFSTSVGTVQWVLTNHNLKGIIKD